MSEWQPMETAPRDGTEILLWFSLPGDIDGLDGHLTFGYWTGHSWGQFYDFGEPTNWMPLPAGV